MEEICPYEVCTGCSACENICPTNAITMAENGPCGFIHPLINQSVCINCGLCRRVCPAVNPVNFIYPQSAFAAISRDETGYKESASGGAASALSESIVKNGGVVYGCAMENWKTIKHKRCVDETSIRRLRSSKYVQSTIGLIFRNIVKDLKDGKKVLFTGTPCQIAGLKKFLQKDYDNLTTIDLVCHGVPSQKLLRDNVTEMLGISSHQPDSNLKVWFREKTFHRQPNIVYGVFLNDDYINRKLMILPDNDYITAFMSCLTIRESCYKCRYAQSKRCSDLTVGDFWGLGKDCSLPIKNGVSLILVNTNKGELFLKENSEFFFLEERSVSEAVNGNGRLQSPSKKPQEREEFIKNYSKNPVYAYQKGLKRYRRDIRQRHFKIFIRDMLKSMPGVRATVKLIRKI